jgi:CheY-like chemotaxis protein
MSAGRTIMVVEDDPDIADAIALVLEDAGYAVTLAPNGREALEALHRARSLPRLILLDLMMPVMDGWQFRAEQKSSAELAAVPVALVSAHIDIRSEAARLDAVGWLKKPIDLQELLRLAEQHCSASAS